MRPALLQPRLAYGDACCLSVNHFRPCTTAFEVRFALSFGDFGVAVILNDLHHLLVVVHAPTNEVTRQITDVTKYAPLIAEAVHAQAWNLVTCGMGVARPFLH
jgi:hypothetical protein